jgi:hypothetical protein
MSQTTLSVALEVKPESVATLSRLIDQLQNRYESPNGRFAAFMSGVPSVHFMSLSVFPGAEFDPLFVLEANFDGAPGVFWGQLEAALAEDLRAMLRCCKQPLDNDATLYKAVTDANSRAPVVPYFEARKHAPTVFHHGNRGMTRDRILAEAQLFGAIRTELATANGTGPSPYRDAEPVEIHRGLRAALVRTFPWLDEPAPARIPALEVVMDIVRLIGFVMAVVFVLVLPGLLLAAIMPVLTFAILMGVLSVVFIGLTIRYAGALPGTATHGKISLLNILFFYPLRIGMVVVAGLIIILPGAVVFELLFANVPPEALAKAVVTDGTLAVASMFFVVLPALLFWLRWLERHDSSHDKPPIDETMMRQMAQREDWIPQNHMGSAVLIRPGVLRMLIIRAGHRGLGLFLRVFATDGYLGSMRTVHFAHWAFANNKSRLLFFSNFDQSWGSYLDDFIEKAHEGLTLAWGCGVGFPPTRFLIEDGASNGRKFKAWARHSMTVSRFWYSAYPDLTVDQIERNNRIANGLRTKSLSDKELSSWLNDL